MKILVTGTAGFIGFHTVKNLAAQGHRVIGIDNINGYYDIDLKYSRLELSGINKHYIRSHQPVKSTIYPNYTFYKADLQDKVFIDQLFSIEKFDVVCHLAAQAGVRFSIENPYSYVNSNIIGFLNILEACRFNPVKHLVYASSSSIYGLNEKVPYSETDQVDTPVSLYAATKKSNELMAHAYGKLYQIPTTGVRFFTVYGPWGRPDMAPFLFMDSIMNGTPIKVFNNGDLSRDFTYIDDIVECLSLILERAPIGELPYNIYNVGAGKPIQLMDFISAIENATGKKAIKQFVDMQRGDVYKTFADTSRLQNDLNIKPQITVEEGISRFFDWYLEHSRKNSKKLSFS
ncbi:MAG TPA: NAD-dependent epimerase/dehydratase family protein [Prolixibacteraceae bacterium]|nr:NAD-dependent epimerase/dehydratase family protein [Prolixibacteraceae bacterium]